jgi:zinc D-Ala-D-Ala carboxypeptidase
VEAVRSGSTTPSSTPVQAVPASTAAVPAASRRSRRPASDAASAPSTPRARARAWLPRAGVLGALAIATIAVPLIDHGAEAATVDAEALTVADAGYPSAYDVLAGGGEAATATSVRAAVQGAERVAAMASRAYDRDPLPGCDGEARPAGQNGLIPASDLCALWVSDQSLRGDAAVALAELNFNFRAAFGRDLCLTDSYRSLADQRRVAALKPGLAASPGTSNHGWGLAIDLCTSENRASSVMTWLQDNGPAFGWDNPQWARAGGSGAFEPWHWEYVPGTSEMGTNY